MSALTSAYNYASTGISNYANAIPRNTPVEALKSLAISFTFATISTANPVSGAIAGVLAATATVIQALVSPFFDEAKFSNSLMPLLRSQIALAGAATVGLIAFKITLPLQMIGFMAAINVLARYAVEFKENTKEATPFIYYM